MAQSYIAIKVINIQTIFLAFLLALLAGCESKDWEAAGFQDGRAATINTTCKFRTTFISGEWGNAKYAKGYSRGANAGAAAVAAQGCDALR
jgi:hypothetical protein